MAIVRQADAVQHRMHGSTFHSFVAPASGSRELCAWRLEVAAEAHGVAHRVGREEVLLMLAGELSVTVDGDTAVVRPGDVVRVPGGSLFRVDNLGAEPASAWVTVAVGFEATLPDGTVIAPPWVR